MERGYMFRERKSSVRARNSRDVRRVYSFAPDEWLWESQFVSPGGATWQFLPQARLLPPFVQRKEIPEYATYLRDGVFGDRIDGLRTRGS